MKFSIVVATYNRKEMMQHCIESILAQTHQDFELIVVDDGSTDGTEKLMNLYSDQRIRYIKLDKNYGTATPARNRGIEEMTGEALIIWDSDDILLPNALAVLQQGFIDCGDAGIVCTSTDFFQGDYRQDNPRTESRYFSAPEWFSGCRPRDAEIIAVLKKYIGDVRFESRGIDFMFYGKIIGGRNPKIYYINETCGRINLESDTLSLTKARRKRNKTLSIERAEILDAYLEKYKAVYLEGGAKNKFAAFCFGSAIGYLRKGDSRQARIMFRKANEQDFHFSWKVLEIVTIIPIANKILCRFI